ncbi:MAG: hypothetical protein KME06_01630 [Kastovskya adunca ATA6-11-RM4]|jgi:hypothetical protein|nr:hypothetical protein [Kastovskya adunca ATA6-11-RM4]
MNSDMDNSSEALYSRLIAWLLQEPVSAPSPLESQSGSAGDRAGAEWESDRLDLLDCDELDCDELTLAFSETDEAASGHKPRNLEEMQTVQNRFQALLKRRLQSEIEARPPLFPWETEISDYEPEKIDVVEQNWVPSVRLWMPQLSKLTLPVPVPEAILSQLLNACSEAVYSRRQLGAKLVGAVTNLFPDCSESLNQLAGMVLMYPSRSPGQPQSLPNSYESAAVEQQMTLAMLAAKEIIKALSVSVSPNQSPVERQWETAAGMVTLKAEYQLQGQTPKLQITTRLPRGGSLTLRTPQATATAERTYPGYLSVESFDLQANQTYPLEIRFQDLEQAPLVFAICPTI